jgi:hypothetical protein
MRRLVAAASWVVGAVLLFAAVPVSAGHAKTDVATINDGNTFIGEVVSVLNATLSIKTDSAGTLSIEWRRVTSLESHFDYRIELSGGQRRFGKLGAQKTPGTLRIVSASGESEVALTEVFEIVPVERKFWQRLDGSVNSGFSFHPDQ